MMINLYFPLYDRHLDYTAKVVHCTHINLRYARGWFQATGADMHWLKCPRGCE